MQRKFIVALGSSAGGLNPLRDFFDHTPCDSAVYVILRHLPHEYQSVLSEILQRHSHLKIVEATDGMHLEANNVYLLPSGSYMTLSGNTLYLTKRNREGSQPNMSIDIFLESLAKEKKCDCIAVILSGAGKDGTKGIHQIKKEGGMVVVQSPVSAEHQSMPVHAIASGNVDHILLPSEMPSIILTHIKVALKN